MGNDSGPNHLLLGIILVFAGAGICVVSPAGMLLVLSGIFLLFICVPVEAHAVPQVEVHYVSPAPLSPGILEHRLYRSQEALARDEFGNTIGTRTVEAVSIQQVIDQNMNLADLAGNCDTPANKK